MKCPGDKLTVLLLSVFTWLTAGACGPGSAEMAQLSAHRADSLKMVMQRRQLLATELRSTQNTISTLRTQLKTAEANLETHLSTSLHGRGVHQETLQSLEHFIARLKQKIAETDDHIFALEREVQRYQ